MVLADSQSDAFHRIKIDQTCSILGNEGISSRGPGAACGNRSLCPFGKCPTGSEKKGRIGRHPIRPFVYFL
jgi:hypothetical protein